MIILMCQLLPPNMVEVDIKRRWLRSLTEEAYKQYVVATFHIEPIPEDAKRNRYNVKGSTFGTFYKISKMKCLCSIQTMRLIG